MPARSSLPFAGVRSFAARHQTWFWWLHSAYALGLGVVFMWLGARQFTWLRVAAFNIVFIWATSVLTAGVVERRAAGSRWWARARLAINYVNRNAYQQVLFFIVPVYYASATAWSANAWFVAVLAVAAVLSTLDLVYDRFLTANRWRAAGFFAFNAFAAVNVALPVLFGTANHSALRLAAAASAAGFATIAIRPGRFARKRTWGLIIAGAVIVFGLAEAARPLVPPAPLRLTGAAFGTGFDRRSFAVVSPLTSATPGRSGRLFVVTAVDAPVGLTDRVSMRWYQGGRLIWASAAHEVRGGRHEGFRLWSAISQSAVTPATSVRVDVVTEAGQLIGRARLPVSAPAR